MKEISYNRICSCQGRNGLSEQKGISITREQRVDEKGKVFECITFEPINNKGEITNAWLQIPLENIDEMIKYLKQLKNIK